MRTKEGDAGCRHLNVAGVSEGGRNFYGLCIMNSRGHDGRFGYGRK